MSRVRSNALAVIGANRRMGIVCPPDAWPLTEKQKAEQCRVAAHWRRAWDAAWRGPALSVSDLLIPIRLCCDS